jgi:hypothetical protein
MDNNLLLGISIGTGKTIIATIISAPAISLIRYPFRDDRKLGHEISKSSLIRRLRKIAND